MLEALTTYGPLGIWVAFSVVRERALIRRMDDMASRFESDRIRWNRERMRWMSILGRRGVVSEKTIMEITDD